MTRVLRYRFFHSLPDFVTQIFCFVDADVHPMAKTLVLPLPLEIGQNDSSSPEKAAAGGAP